MIAEMPNDAQVEKAVLGCFIIEEQYQLMPRLKKELFYQRKHRLIAEAIISLGNSAAPYDSVSVTNWLRDHDKLDLVGGVSYILSTIEEVVTTASTEHYLSILEDKYMRRSMIEMAVNLNQKATSADIPIDELRETTEEMVERMVSQNSSQQKTMSEAVSTALPHIISELNGEMGLSTGFKTLDKKIKGLSVGSYIIAGRPGEGKCLGKGTKVLMHDGTIKNVEDIKNGEAVMGPDSLPRTVSGTTKGRGTLYKIFPNKGDPWICNSDHILSLMCSSNVNNKFKSGQVYNMSIIEFLGLPPKTRDHLKLYRSKTINFPELEVPLDPYFLGLWLGDGTSAGSGITTADTEVIKYLQKMADNYDPPYKLHKTTLKDNKADTYNITGDRTQKSRNNSPQATLRRLGVLGNKHVPNLYKINSEKVRLRLLAGYIDADGYANRNGYYVTSIQESLLDDIIFIARSLGFAATKHVNYKNYSSMRLSNYKVYKTFIYGDVDRIPTKIARKQYSPHKRQKNHLVTGFTISKIESGDYYGFELDKDGLFLLGDFTVTHNTSIALNMMLRQANAGHKVGFISIEMPLEKVLAWMLDFELKRDHSYIPVGGTRENWIASISEMAQAMKSLPIIIDDRSYVDVAEVVSSAYKMKFKYGVEIIYIDYMQLLEAHSSRDGSREQEVAKISRSLLGLKKKLGIPIVTLCQINRESMKRTNQRPRLEDLRESGAIEQDADVVMMLYDPSHHGEKGPHEIHIPKNRSGSVTLIDKPIKLLFNKPAKRFEEAADDW